MSEERNIKLNNEQLNTVTGVVKVDENVVIEDVQKAWGPPAEEQQ